MRAATSGLRCAPFASVRWRSRPRRSLHCALRPPPANQPARQASHVRTSHHESERDVRAHTGIAVGQ